MLKIASEITICLLLAALLGFIIGYLLGKIHKKNSKKSQQSSVEKIKISTADKGAKTELNIPPSPTLNNETDSLSEIEVQKDATQPMLLNSPKDKIKDPLTQIKGIGPKVEEQLNTAGIYYFEQIANWDEKNIAWLETHTAFAHRAKKDLWVNQAKALLS